MMVLAVTLHNIPEGMAVGVMYAGFLAGSAQITAASALALSLSLIHIFGQFPQGVVLAAHLIGIAAGHIGGEQDAAELVSYTHLSVSRITLQ